MKIVILFSGLTQWRPDYTQSVRDFLGDVKFVAEAGGGRVDNMVVEISLTTELVVDAASGAAFPGENPKIVVRASARSVDESMSLAPGAEEKIAKLLVRLIGVVDPASQNTHKSIVIDFGLPTTFSY